MMVLLLCEKEGKGDDLSTWGKEEIVTQRRKEKSAPLKSRKGSESALST